jgi:hypothetical protein
MNHNPKMKRQLSAMGVVKLMGSVSGEIQALLNKRFGKDSLKLGKVSALDLRYEKKNVLILGVRMPVKGECWSLG